MPCHALWAFFLGQEFSAQGFENSGYEWLQAGHALFTLPRSPPVLTDFYLTHSHTFQPMITLEFGTSGENNSERVTILKLDMIWPNGLL